MIFLLSAAVSRSRWYAKKGARRAMQELSWSSGSLALRRLLARGSRVRALTYHRFGQGHRDPFCVSEANFERQMHWLAERELAISLKDLESFLAGDASVPQDGTLITIDDGFRSVHRVALPILARYEIPAVVFISAGLIGNADASRREVEPYLSWDELAELVAAGITVGSHAMTHQSLGAMNESQVREECLRSRELLEKRLGPGVETVAYPFGTRGDFSDVTARVLKETGYRCVFTSQHGAIGPRADPMCLPRVKVEGGEGLRPFRLLCSGGMDAWRAVDYALWWIQSPQAAARLDDRPAMPSRG
jgi:peptidoglycan/xylan/chitin deacetylase (PgdA/CDA1 family)